MKLCKDCKNHGSCKKPYSSNSNYAERCKNFDKKHITNFEKIKKMSIEEMAQSDMEIFTCPYTLVDETYGFMCKEFNDDCTSCIKHWLESEAEE